MLVLSRRVGQKIMVDVGRHRLTITVTDVDQGRTKLGFEGPREFTILREELLTDPPEPDAFSEGLI